MTRTPALAVACLGLIEAFARAASEQAEARAAKPGADEQMDEVIHPSVPSFGHSRHVVTESLAKILMAN
jgi:hypothetical protein